MTRQIAVDLLILIVGTLLGAFWCLGLARQSLSQVSLAFEREYSASLPIVRQIIGPLMSCRSVASHPFGRRRKS